MQSIQRVESMPTNKGKRYCLVQLRQLGIQKPNLFMHKFQLTSVSRDAYVNVLVNWNSWRPVLQSSLNVNRKKKSTKIMSFVNEGRSTDWWRHIRTPLWPGLDSIFFFFFFFLSFVIFLWFFSPLRRPWWFHFYSLWVFIFCFEQYLFCCVCLLFSFGVVCFHSTSPIDFIYFLFINFFLVCEWVCVSVCVCVFR